jgi:hypothetical protein
LVNRDVFWIHHVIKPARFCRLAFIFGEAQAAMVNRWCAEAICGDHKVPAVNPMLNRICLKLGE